MIFWITLGILVLGIIGIVIFYSEKFYDDTMLNISFGAVVISAIVFVAVFGVIFGTEYLGLDGRIAADQQRYESLVYQLDNNLYENDNDLGKKELMNQIQEWNEDLAKGKATQRDFWIGIFIPNIFDQFDYIPLNGTGDDNG